MFDSKGALHRKRSDIQQNPDFYEKWKICMTTNSRNSKEPIAVELHGADVLIALSKSGPGVVNPAWVSTMARDAIVFACSNPVPEIWPWEAREAGARIVATGRSDFSNQVNNSLGFPGIFRGVLDVRASTITDEMCIDAAEEIASTAEDRGLGEEYIIPSMEDWEVFPREATAVGMRAIEQGIAKKVMSRGDLYKISEAIIRESRVKTQLLMEHGFIKHIDEPV
jgi:malate dehydrogenase (oxaloacetate-decarboxylating)